jgi:hypothetical protein
MNDNEIAIPVTIWKDVRWWCLENLILDTWDISDHNYGMYDEYKIFAFSNLEDITAIKLRFSL